jgi:DNA-binding transcriptional LysR family regulator
MRMPKGIDWEAQIGRRLRLRDLHAFVTVVKWGSMARAAEQLGVSQPAISKIIADLEHMLGVRLLDRSRRGVEPTIYGNALLKRGMIAFDELKQGIRDIEYLADPTGGELTIGCADSIASTVLLPIVDCFRARYPRVAFRVDTVPSPAINYPGLHDRKYDLVLGRWPMQLSNLPDELRAEFLFDDGLIVAAGAHTRWAQRRKIDLAELADEPWILPPPERWTYAQIAQAFQARGLGMPRVSLMTFSLPLVTHFLADGPFIAAFPRSVASLHSSGRLLKALPVNLPPRPWPVAIVTLKNRALSPVVERFIECAQEVAKAIAAKFGKTKLGRNRPG